MSISLGKHQASSFKGNAWSLPQLQRALCAAATLLLLLVVFFYDDRFTPEPNRNTLAMSGGMNSGVTVIESAAPISFGGIGREEVLAKRIVAVNRHSELLGGEYRPSDAVFGRLKDRSEWFSESGFFIKGRGEQSTVGVSYLSTGVLSPYQLVIPTFWGASIWGDGKLKWKPEVLSQPESFPDLPLHPKSLSLNWDRSSSNAYIYWQIGKFLEEVAPYLQKPLSLEDLDFGVSLYNARDFNLRFVSLDLARSSGIDAPKFSGQAVRISEHFSFSDTVCGVAKGCNHIRNVVPELDTILVRQLPAVATFLLWKKAPQPSQQPDFTYTITLE